MRRVGFDVWLGVLLRWFWLVLACASAATGAVAAESEVARLPGCTAAMRLTDAERIGPGPAAAERVTLPDRLPRGEMARVLPATYRIVLPACALERALSIPHAASAYRLWVDGQPAARAAPSDTWWLPAPTGADLTNPRVPTLYRLPAGATLLEVEVSGAPFIPVGLWAVTVGPHEAVAPLQAHLYRRAIEWTLVAGQVVAVLGGLAMLLLLAQRRRQPGLIWFVVACAVWVMRGVYSTTSTLALPPLLFETGVALLVFMLSVPLAIATLQLLGRWTIRWRRAAWATCPLVVGLLGTGLHWPSAAFQTRTAVYLLMLGWLALTCVIALRHRRAIGSWRGWVLVSGYVALLAGAVHDFLLVQGQGQGPVSDDMISLLVWGYLWLLVAFALISAHLVVQALDRAETLNVELEQRVDERSMALQAEYELRQVEQLRLARERARTEERERVVREMHDGIGGQLMTALRGVERGALSGDRLAHVLQDSLDDLRLLIDASHAATELGQALAAWRHRWDPRLEALGIELAWSVDDAVADLEWSPDTVLQLMRILQEAVVNALKHAQARQVRVSVRVHDDALELRVEDDGRGLPTTLLAGEGGDQPGHHGLRSMRRRASQIGAVLVFQAMQPQGAALYLRRPLVAGDNIAQPPVDRGVEGGVQGKLQPGRDVN